MSVFLAVTAVWGLLLCACVAANDQARKMRSRERWRSIMAGLVGLGVTFKKGGKR